MKPSEGESAMSVAVESQPAQAEPRAVMRYEVVEAAGSHVLRDVVMDEFCCLPDESGCLVLLAFPDAYHARLWLMTADTRKRYALSTTRVRAEERKGPTEEHAGWLLFDLYTPVPPDAHRPGDARSRGRRASPQAALNAERGRHWHHPE
jgi:hypothetical protein